jgi:glycosyltransferase involved in cell wall biosynthesis
VGGKHITLPVDSKNPLQIMRNAGKIAAIVREQKVDIIHARSRAPAWSAWHAAQKTGVPLVTSFHGAYGMQNKLKRWYNGVMIRGVRVIAVSNFIREYILGYYPISAERIDVVQRGIDLQKFDAARVHRDRVIKLATEWAIPDDKPIVMLPGRISHWKGQRELLLALAELPHRNFYCLFVGSDHGHESYRAEIEKLVGELELNGLVKWVGECRDMPAAYMLADVVVSASQGPEAFGRVAIEAQAMGRPLAATNHGGSAETIIDKQTGFLCPPGNIGALGRTVNKLLGFNAQARETLGAAAIKHVRANFGVEKMCAGEFATYQKVLAQTVVAAKAA